MKQEPSGGAFRFAISSLRITCSAMLPPPPPTSFGHEKPTQRFARTLRCHSAEKARVALALGRQVLVEEARAPRARKRLLFRGEVEVHAQSPPSAAARS